MERGERPDGQQDQEGGDQWGSPANQLSPALKQETVVVFDWDDTILPTSWLERIHALTGGSPLRPEIQRQMAQLCTVAAQTLTLAGTLGVVIIITNSAPGWVDQSCQLFMPQIAAQVRNYPIFSKPMHAPLTFKITTFRRECRQYRNLISVGDGDAERAASLRLQAPADRKGIVGGDPLDANRRVKSVKLLELPTCQQLIAEHEMLQVRLPDVAAFQGSLDLKARFQGNVGSAGAKASPGGTSCALVHFSRPIPVTAGPRTADEVKATVPFRGLRVGPIGAQLPPLGRAHPATAGEVEFGSRRAENGIGLTSPPHGGGTQEGERRKGSTAAAGPGGEAVKSATQGEEASADGAPGTRGSPGGTLWKVHDVSDQRAVRSPAYQSPGKKRPVLGSALGSKGTNAVWREQVPVTGRSF